MTIEKPINNQSLYMKNRVLFAILLIASVVSSCKHYKEEYRNDECYRIYKVKSISCTSHVIPELEYDPSFDFLSREFYSDLDSTLAIKGWFPKRGYYHKMMYQNWSLIDWRITKIDVVTLEDYDKDHPAGSSMNDVLMLRYSYKEEFVKLPLDNIQYGDVMLMDCYPARVEDSIRIDNDGLSIELKSDYLRRPMPLCEVKIEDSFGNKFSGIIDYNYYRKTL